MERSFTREIGALQEVFDFIAGILDSCRADSSSRYAISLAVEELFTNMVKYNPEGSGDITLSIARDGGRMIVTIVDRDVQPFDVTQTADVDTSLPLHERRVGGLGIHLVKQIVDDLRYEYADSCSTITIVKNLEP